MARLYEVRQAAAILGVSPRRIESWIERGFIVPRVLSRGIGRRNKFDLTNVAQGALLLELQAVAGERSSLGSEVLAEVGHIARGLVTGASAPKPDDALFVFYTEGRPTRAKRLPASSPAALAAAIRAGQTVLVVSVAAIRRRIREHLAKVPAYWQGR
jgi:phage terminase Nu1 subunit (DNA packaging protein)